MIMGFMRAPAGRRSSMPAPDRRSCNAPSTDTDTAAVCGWRPTLPAPRAVATMLSGAWPSSSQANSGVMRSAWSVAGPPQQCPMPGNGEQTQKIRGVAVGIALDATLPALGVIDRVDRVADALVDDHLRAAAAQFGRVGRRHEFER